ncbi:MAG: TIGR03862 family flavoprotein [Nitrospiraceae bacterium]
MPLLRDRGVEIAPLKPANCGFDVGWSEFFRTKFAGQPVKTVGLVAKGVDGEVLRRQGEFVITERGIEGGVVYAVAACLRDVIDAHGKATLRLDLAPDRQLPRLIADLAQPRGKRTVATQLKRRAHIEGVKSGLLRELLPKDVFNDPQRLAPAIKSLPLTLTAARPLAEAISTAGGVRFEALDERLMCRKQPGLFFAGEMLDWEAPTGGYLLNACFASGRIAGAGAAAWANEQAGA